jgi:hypothetical protein
MDYTELSDAIKSYTQNYETAFVNNISTFVQQAENRIYKTVLFPVLRKNVTAAFTPGFKYLSCPNDFLAVFSLASIDLDNNYEYLLNKDVNFLRAAYPNPNDTGLPQYYSLFGPTITSGAITNDLSFIVAPTPDIAYDVELHYYYYPESIVQSSIASSLVDISGYNYTNGVYYNIPLTGGAGFGAHATIVVAGNVVESATITNPGSYYVVDDILFAPSNLIGNGTDFQLAVLSVNNPTGTSWVGNNYSPVLLYGCLVEAYTFMKGEADMVAQYEKKYQDALAQLIRLGNAMEHGDAYRKGGAVR